MPLLPIPTTAPMSMQQAMASTTCVLQVPRTASTASAAHTLRYPARDETSKATPSAAELEIMIRPGYCRHRRQRACPAEVPYCCTSLAHIVHVRLRPRPETTRHDTTRSGAAVRLDKSQLSLQAKVGVGSGSSLCTASSSRGPHPCLAPCTSTRRLPPESSAILRSPCPKVLAVGCSPRRRQHAVCDLPLAPCARVAMPHTLCRSPEATLGHKHAPPQARPRAHVQNAAPSTLSPAM